MRTLFNVVGGAIVVVMVLSLLIRFVILVIETFGWVARRPGESAGARNPRMIADVAFSVAMFVFAGGFCAVAMVLVKDRRGLETVACLFFPVAAVVATVGWWLWKKLRV